MRSTNNVRGAKALALAGVALLAAGANAQTVAFDNFIFGDIATTVMLVVRGPDAGPPTGGVYEVVPSASGRITEIVIPIFQLSADHEDEYFFRVYEDLFGEPGDLLAEWPVPSSTDLEELPILVETDQGPWIDQDVRYWMGVTPGPNSYGGWTFVASSVRAELWFWRGHGALWESGGYNLMGGLRVIVDDTPPCAPDLNGDGVVDADDFFLFLQLFADADSRADFNSDGVIDADDFFAFLAAFAQGCG